MKKWVALVLIAALFVPAAVWADTEESDGGYYTIHAPDGGVLLRIAGQVSMGDEYISADNRRYEITQVDETAKRAAAVFVEEVTLPEIVFPVDEQDWVPRVALYCTHTDESYIEGDGTESIAEGGGILDVAGLLSEALQAEGCEAVLDETNHVPHDGGAYRRSRKTAVALMKEEWPTLLLDIHRDAVPEDEYLEKVEGEEISSVRIVVGKGNTNYPVNEELAQTVKSIADSRYPGLIKDIYLGKGDYNQDLMARSLLLEFGSHETDKDMAEKSTQYLAEVIAVTLGAAEGNAAAPAGTADPQTGATPAPTKAAAVPPVDTDKPEDVGNSPWKSIGIIALILAAVGGVILFFFVRSGERGASAGHLVREMTGMGAKPEQGRGEKK